MSRQLEEENKKQQEALSAALDRLNAGEEQLQESEDLAGFLETACWVRQSVEPPPQLLQETLERLEMQAPLPEASLPEKSGLLPPRKRSWLYAGALGLAASVLLALQLLPSSPLPVAVVPQEAQQTAAKVALAPLHDEAVLAERKAASIPVIFIPPLKKRLLQSRQRRFLQLRQRLPSRLAAKAVEFYWLSRHKLQTASNSMLCGTYGCLKRGQRP